jgi:copper(I)-binding protein
MSLKTTLLAGACALLPSLAIAEMMVTDPYARAAGAMAQSGAAFMEIMNMGETDDRLIAAASDAANRVELHTHVVDGDVMRMVHVEEGFAIPAGEAILLERGGMHVMFMGLTRALEQGDEIEVTLTFEEAGEMTVMIPVDNERSPSKWARACSTGSPRTTAEPRHPACAGHRPSPVQAGIVPFAGRGVGALPVPSLRAVVRLHLPDSTSSTHAGTARVAGPVRTRSNRPGPASVPG